MSDLPLDPAAEGPDNDYYTSEASARAGLDERPEKLFEYLSSLRFAPNDWAWAARIAMSEGVAEKVRDQISDDHALQSWKLGMLVTTKKLATPNLAESIIQKIRRMISDLRNPPRFKDRIDKDKIPGLEITEIIRRQAPGDDESAFVIKVKFNDRECKLTNIDAETLAQWGKFRVAAAGVGCLIDNERMYPRAWSKMLAAFQANIKFEQLMPSESLQSAIAEEICKMIVGDTVCEHPDELKKGYVYVRRDAFGKPDVYYLSPNAVFAKISATFTKESPERRIIGRAVASLGAEMIQARFLEAPKFRPRVYKFSAFFINSFYNSDDTISDEISSPGPGAGGDVAKPAEENDPIWPSGDGQDEGVS